MMWIKQTIGEQRKALAAVFEPAMLNLSKQCVKWWSDIDGLDQVLKTHFSSVPHCHLLYTLDKLGKQLSSNISINGIDSTYRDQDLSRRPYSVSLYPKRHFTLSSVYISQTTGRPCISAVHPVIDEQQFLGFVVADFDLRHLPLFVTPSKNSSFWQSNCHFSSANLLQHRRIPSVFDKCLDDIQGILTKLICEHGVFHCTIHYASAQAVIWQVDDPYQYHLYPIEQLLEPNMYLTYPRHVYPFEAKLPNHDVKPVLERFMTLRLADDTLYLRSGSLNIMNAMISLSFSFDGSQYMPAEVFLNKDLSYWFGQVAVNAN